jgi:hypothetical protein
MEIVGLDTALLDAVRAEVERQLEERPVGWLDVDGAAAHLAMTPKAVRDALAKSALPVHRTPTGRLRFRPSELDEWVVGEHY